MYSLPNLRSSKERGAFPRRKPCTSTFWTSLRYALSEAFSSSSQLSSTSRTASLVGNFSTETFTFPPTHVFQNQISLKQPGDGQWWAVRDSNSHGFHQRILSPSCLPISATALSLI